MIVKPPSGLQPPLSPQTTGPDASQPVTKGVQTTANIVDPEAVAKALKDYKKLRGNLKKPFLSGAAGLFTDSVVFPAELLDSTNPANDAKYLHLFFAVFGLKELERIFATPEQEEEMDEEGEEESTKDE